MSWGSNPDPEISGFSTESRDPETTGNTAHHVFLSLGANLGDPLNNLRSGVFELAKFSLVRPTVSSPWITTPVNCPPDSPPFANAAVYLILTPSFAAESFLQRCQIIEKTLGRKPPTAPNQARPLDIDLIAFDDLVMTTRRLILPHPRVRQRYFVLAPLHEIAPKFVLPGQTLTVAELLAACPPDPSARRLNDFRWQPSDKI